MGPEDVKIAMKAVGICGSDIHYYKSGKIGGFVVKKHWMRTGKDMRTCG